MGISIPAIEERKEEIRKAQKAQFSDSEYADMRAMLDDSSVSSHVRNNMLYALASEGKLSDGEIDKYAGQVGADAEDVKAGGEAPIENILHARESLDKFNKGKIEDAQKHLDEGGFKTSDDIVDETKPMVKLFEDFHPLYKQVKQLKLEGGQGQDKPEYVQSDLSEDKGSGSGSGKYNHSGGAPDQIRAGLKEFRAINFGTFEQDASMLATAGKAVDGAKESLDKTWSQGTSDWTGDAKQAAQQQNKGNADNANKLSQGLGKAPENIRTVNGDNKKNVVEYAKAVLKLYGDGKISGLTQEQVANLIKAHKELPGALKELNAAIREIENKGFWDRLGEFLTSPFQLVGPLLGPIGPIIGYVVASEITEDNIYEERDKIKQAQADTKQKLQDFVGGYDKKVKGFHDQGRAAGNAIQKNYSTLIQQLGKDLDGAFSAPPGPGGDGNGSDVQTINNPGGGGNQQQAGGGGGGSFTPPQPGGGGNGGGGSFTPPQSGGGAPGEGAGGQMPGGSGQGDGDQPKPGDAGEGKNPVTGGKLETDPETGEPYPIDPATGEAVKDATERDTLTVEQGDKKFELAEPNAKGEMEISVEDGKGPLKDYKLDFGDGDEASGGAQPGGQTEGGSGQSQGSGQAQGAGQGQGAGEPRQQESGLQGSADGAEDAQNAGQGEKVYTPDEDGKIRIQDGDTEIVAEQPDGPDGPTKVTVDDGKGEPTTYTLGEEQGEPSAAGGGSGIRPGGGGAEFAGDGTPAEAAGMGGPEGAVQDGAAEVGPGSESAAQAASTSGGAADAGSVAGDLASGGGGSPAQPDGEAMQAGAAPGSPADAAGAMSGSMGAADGGSPELGADGHADAAGQPGVDQPAAGGAGGSDDSTSPAASLGSSLGEDALGGGSGEASDSSLGDAGMGGSAAGDSAADTGDGDSGGSGGSGDRGGGSGGAGMGGGMMGGGMGGAGGGGGGGDEERQSQFILDAVSDLFGEAVAGNHITGTIGEGAGASVSFGR